MSDFDVANVEYELERMRTEQPETVSNNGGCGCFSLKLFLMFVIGIFLFRLILVFFHFFIH